MVTSVIFDYVGAFGVAVDETQSVSAFKVIGIICVLIGAVMVNLAFGVSSSPPPQSHRRKSAHHGALHTGLSGRAEWKSYLQQ